MFIKNINIPAIIQPNQTICLQGILLEVFIVAIFVTFFETFIEIKL